jgi:hypothetical protein
MAPLFFWNPGVSVTDPRLFTLSRKFNRLFDKFRADPFLKAIKLAWYLIRL